MDTRQLIDNLSNRLDVSRETIQYLLEGFIDSIRETMEEQNSLTIPNFGVFEPKIRQERISVHPATGKKLLVPPRISISFKCSPVLKQKINGK